MPQSCRDQFIHHSQGLPNHVLFLSRQGNSSTQTIQIANLACTSGLTANLRGYRRGARQRGKFILTTLLYPNPAILIGGQNQLK
ncbi:MAG: hypothetical protein HC934_13890 [Acaryochloridaceae cyanobacterium SU_2_1]|nr:hypothetical protein [Acaryochloridaceae cyanobacterium SU_2_1]